ncbi:hypothetical protein EAI_15476 [Harpegnathos saltator]|uniref:Uncharacterized protein n=1 Tax=Harpegnathos saltator TaxID=610380 RepID=E2BC54_HARSA|nr:hypothetical protein EAI_15476 [Harpegnathos saltator]
MPSRARVSSQWGGNRPPTPRVHIQRRGDIVAKCRAGMIERMCVRSRKNKATDERVLSTTTTTTDTIIIITTSDIPGKVDLNGRHYARCSCPDVHTSLFCGNVDITALFELVGIRPTTVKYGGLGYQSPSGILRITTTAVSQRCVVEKDTGKKETGDRTGVKVRNTRAVASVSEQSAVVVVVIVVG